MNSELITRNDLATVLGNLGIRGHVGTFTDNKTITTTTTGAWFDVTQIQLPTNSKFLVFIHLNEVIDAGIKSGVQIIASGTPVESLNLTDPVRTNTGSGNGIVNWAYIKTGDSPVTAIGQGYNYAGTAHEMHIRMIAIQFLDNLTISEIASEAGTFIPTINKTAKFDMSAHMNSEDMTNSELQNFIGELEIETDTQEPIVGILQYYPVGSYYETSDSTFDPNIQWGGVWENPGYRESVYAYGSHKITAGQAYNLASITLQPNTKYMVLAHESGSTGVTMTYICYIQTSGNEKSKFGEGSARTYVGSGGGVSTWQIIETGSTAVTATVTCHGYNTDGHTEIGWIYAYPIDRPLETNKWHRIA